MEYIDEHFLNFLCREAVWWTDLEEQYGVDDIEVAIRVFMFLIPTKFSDFKNLQNKAQNFQIQS